MVARRPDEGFTIDLHEGMPGWLLKEGSSFELTGEPQTGHYRFHRVAHLPDEQVFGLSGPQDPDPAASARGDSGYSETWQSPDDRLS